MKREDIIHCSNFCLRYTLGTLVDSKKIARQVDDVFTHLIFNKIVQEI